MDAMMLSNVCMAKNKSKEGKQLQSNLNDIVYALATTNPTWTFVCNNSSYDERLNYVEITCDGQTLGNLSRAYSGRSGGNITKVCVTNIRGHENNLMSSIDDKKVIREVKKNFKPRSIDAILKHKFTQAVDVVHDQKTRKSREAYDQISEVREYIYAFGMEQERQKLEEYLLTKAQGDQMLGRLHKHDEFVAEVKAIGDIERVIMTDKTIFIMVEGSKYFVRALDIVQTYDDNTLPYEYRAKLGMLKLVGKEQCIEGVGCRASDNTFIIINP